MLIKLEIIRKNIEKNLLKIEEINKNIIYVLKDDAYGLGIENVLPILIENNKYNFAVAYIEEALKIREIINKKYSNISSKVSVMLLNYIESENLKIALKNNIDITIYGIFQLEEYVSFLDKLNLKNKINVHLKMNTGMNRLGLNIDEIEKIEKFINKDNKNFNIISVYSHISNAEDEIQTEKQVNKFNEILELLKRLDINYKYTHIQASPLLFKYKEKYNYNFARVGMTIYGMQPLHKIIGLKNTISLKSKIIHIRDVEKGDKISYGENNITTENKKIAIIPIGYAHGLQKQIENSENIKKQKSYVLINGEKAEILGEICMDMIIVDITKIKNVKINDEVVIIGKQGNEEITLLKMSEWADTIQDDILTKLNKNIIKEIV